MNSVSCKVGMRRVMFGFAAVLLIQGCGADPKPFDYQPVSEIPDRPGLFTGDSGSYEIVVTREEPARDGEAAGSGPRQGSLPRPAEHPPYTSGPTISTAR